MFKLNVIINVLTDAVQFYKLGINEYIGFFSIIYTRIKNRTVTLKDIFKTFVLIVYLVWTIYTSSIQMVDMYKNGYIQSVKNGFYRNRYELSFIVCICVGFITYFYIYEPIKYKQQRIKIAYSILEKEFSTIMTEARKNNYIDIGPITVFLNPSTGRYQRYTVFNILDTFADKLDFDENVVRNMFIRYSTKNKKYESSVGTLLENYPKLCSLTEKHITYLNNKLNCIKETTPLPDDVVDYIIAKYYL